LKESNTQSLKELNIKLNDYIEKLSASETQLKNAQEEIAEINENIQDDSNTMNLEN